MSRTFREATNADSRSPYTFSGMETEADWQEFEAMLRDDAAAMENPEDSRLWNREPEADCPF